MKNTACFLARTSLWLGCGCSALGCTATISGGENGAPAGTTAGSMGSASGASSGGASSAPALDPKTGTPSTCDATTALAAPSPILRLTNREYQNTLADLFPGLNAKAAALAADNKDDGFDTIASAQSISPALIEGYFNEATNVATAAVAELPSWLPCAAGASKLAPECSAQFLSDFSARAYRRPATSDELTRLKTLFDAAENGWGEPKGVELTIRAVLQSPAFLYRPELGLPPAKAATTTPLTGYEMASRLAYLFWDSMPDAALTAAAKNGELDSAEGVAEQARRLLTDARAHAAVATFQSQWLRFEKMANLTKSAALFPSFSAKTAAALTDSAARYVDYLFWQRGTLDALLTDTKAYVSDELAPIYGVAKPGSTELELVDVDPTQRAGVLTQAGLLAGFAHETSDAPVLRGVFVMSRLLCDSPPPPPPNIPPAPEAKPGDAPMTTRQRLQQTHVKAACVGCHDSIDGIGFGFSHYDAIGAWRDTDSGLPVDATGVLSRTLDVDGPFNGAVELGGKLAKSAQVKACVAQQWYRYALGITAEDVDGCALKSTIEHFNASGNDLRELLIALVSSDAFRRRTVITP